MLLKEEILCKGHIQGAGMEQHVPWYGTSLNLVILYHYIINSTCIWYDRDPQSLSNYAPSRAHNVVSTVDLTAAPKVQWLRPRHPGKLHGL